MFELDCLQRSAAAKIVVNDMTCISIYSPSDLCTEMLKKTNQVFEAEVGKFDKSKIQWKQTDTGNCNPSSK